MRDEITREYATRKAQEAFDAADCKREPEESPAALLREAAQTLREKAEAVIGGFGDWHDATDLIALADPTFALAVADWLDAEAGRVAFGASSRTHDGAPMFPPRPQALAVARAVLRRES